MGAAGLAYLLERVALLEDRVRALVAHRRRTDTAPEDPFRGLYLSDEAVDRLLAPPDPAAMLPGADGLLAAERDAAAAEAAGADVRLRRLARDAGLTALDVELLLIALVPDLDSRFERL